MILPLFRSSNLNLTNIWQLVTKEKVPRGAGRKGAKNCDTGGADRKGGENCDTGGAGRKGAKIVTQEVQTEKVPKMLVGLSDSSVTGKSF